VEVTGVMWLEVGLAAVAAGVSVSPGVTRRGRLARRWVRKQLGLPYRGKPPSAAVRRAVMGADGWVCVFCGSPARPEWDHVRPDARGFAATRGNGAVLCHVHNRVKSDYWQDREGRVFYHPWPGSDDVGLAAEIYAAERAAQRSPGRWARLYLGGW
jgi:hypothetical protein